jgi:CubicO group peptidase (beta-lactamase class C family)
MKKLYVVSILVFIIITVFVAGCKTPETGSTSRAPAYWPTSGWQTSTPERQGMASEKIADMIEYIMANSIPVHSIHIVRNGYLVTEVYFYPYNGTTVHDIASVTKSVTSMLVGAAINKGLIKDEYTPVKNFFPEYNEMFHNTLREQMTIRDLLTMTSGLELVTNDSTRSPFAEATLFGMFTQDDWLEYILTLPALYEPGTHFGYNSCNFHLLSLIMSRATGMKMADFARENLFKPLGINDFIWPEDPKGHNHGWGDLKLHPRDMAKIGFLFLNNGIWDGEQIIDPNWVAKSAQRQVDVPGPPGDIKLDYSYGWWVISGKLNGIYEANGRGGQHIIIWPQQNLVVVLTGGGFDQGKIAEHLIATISSQQALPENNTAFQDLQDIIDRAGQIPAGFAMVQFPPIARVLSGKTLFLEENPLELENINLTFTDPQFAQLKMRRTGIEQLINIRMGRVYAISGSGAYDLPVAARGMWENDTTLSIEINEIANISNYKVTAVFSRDKATLSVYEPTLFTKPIVIKGVY